MADEMVTARVDEHGRMVRLYVWQGRDPSSWDEYLAPRPRGLGEPERGDVARDVYPGAEPPMWRAIPAAVLRGLIADAEARGVLGGKPEVHPSPSWRGGGGPSERALEAADDREAKAGLVAAHDPALGLDRSVCLRDVVDYVRGQVGAGEEAMGERYAASDVADRISAQFGGGS